MNIYDKNGYLNFNTIMSIDKPFIFIIGARGTGKTYGALDYAINHCTPFLYMRRTQAQVDLLAKDAMNPFNALNADKGYNITPEKLNKYLTDFVQDEKTIATMIALSTVANIRGFDASKYNTLIFDEFIQEKHERRMKNEGLALMNAYETINRNRELTGRKPLKCLFLGNSNTINSDIMAQFGILETVGKMSLKNQTLKICADKPVAIIILKSSPVSNKKATTVLYQLGNAEFNNMALENKFGENDFDFIHSEDLKQFRALCSLSDGLTVFRHKSEKKYYIVDKVLEAPEKFDIPRELSIFKRKYFVLPNAFEFGLISFNNIVAKLKFLGYYS